MLSSLRISNVEYQFRVARLQEYLEANRLSGVVLFHSHHILYYTGFAFIPTERPIAFIMNAKGEKALFVPQMEVQHAEANALVDRVDHYIEYPYHPHPMHILKQTMADMGVGDLFGLDANGYPWIFGYRGPSLSDLIDGQPKRVGAFIEDALMIKSPAELALIRESVKWGNLAHTLLQRFTRVGASETEVSARASMEATLAMLDAIGPIYRAQSPFAQGASAGYRGQIGRNAAIPHAMASNITFQAGDVVVTGAGAPMWGYHSELERTMIIGPATDKQKRMFEHMVALQDTALNTMKPGVRCSEVDHAVRAYYEKQDLMPYWKHHSGHAIGVRYHEAPFLDVGDPTRLIPGMVFTVEPGLYIPELGGFRHSDTVAISEDGIEILTYYPRDLDSLTLPE